MQMNFINNYKYKISRKSVRKKSRCSVRAVRDYFANAYKIEKYCYSSRLLDPVRKENWVGIHTRIVLDVRSEVTAQLGAESEIRRRLYELLQTPGMVTHTEYSAPTDVICTGTECFMLFFHHRSDMAWPGIETSLRSEYCIVVGSRRLMPPDALQPKAYCTNPGL